MRPAQVPPQWRKISTRMLKHTPSALARLKPKPQHSNLLRRLLSLRHFSKWLSGFTQRFTVAMAVSHQTPILTATQTPVAKISGDLCGLLRMQAAHPELLLPESLPHIGARYSIQEQKGDLGLTDKALAWTLAPVFFCCVVAEKARPPQTWRTTEVFSRIVVSLMLKLFVLATNLTRGKQHKQADERLEEGE
ncbi:hypothetical protein V7S43_004404 [Phytophthora oleae]|uniref:Uncharacterized protein n=1 Tax=Phytophthora oleae TaxID=2107226 RepID=A0ABD3FWU9_9STRA